MLHWFKKPQQTLIKDQAAVLTTLFAVWDKQIKSYGPLIEGMDADEVKASLVQLFRDSKAKENQLVRFADKFELHQFGKYNKKTGQMTGCDKPNVLFCLDELKD